MFINYFTNPNISSQELTADFALNKEIIPLDSQMGKERLERSFHLPYLILKDYYETQWKNYCGVASSVMLLNAFGMLDAFGQPYTQESFFTDSVIPLKNPETVSKQGFSFEELIECLKTFSGLNTQEIYGDAFEISAGLGHLFKDLMQREDVFVIANFHRKTLG